MRFRVSWSAVLVVAGTVLAIAFAGYLVVTWPPSPPAPPRSAANVGAPSTPTGQPKVLAVLGDSFSAPSSASAGREWPQLVGKELGWTVYTSAVDGSGYISPGNGRPFGGRVGVVLQHSPDVIVVAGGVGDIGSYPVPRIRAAADRVVSQLVSRAPQAKVVLVSPFSNGPPGPLTNQLSGALAQVAQENGVPYVQASHVFAKGTGLFAPDGVHPTDTGQQRLARRMDAAFQDLGLAPKS